MAMLSRKQFMITAQSVASVLLVVGIGAVASLVGGEQLRTARPAVRDLAVFVPQQLVPGAPITIRWEVPADANEAQQVAAAIRIAGTLHAGDMQSIGDGFATVVVPCNVGERASIVVIDHATNQVLANQAVSALPPGRDCVNR